MNHRQALMAQLESERNPNVAYQLVLLILYHKHFQAAIHVCLNHEPCGYKHET